MATKKATNLPAGKAGAVPFKTLLEPDGKYGPGLKPSHWFAPDKKLLDDAHAKAGDTVGRTHFMPTRIAACGG